MIRTTLRVVGLLACGWALTASAPATADDIPRPEHPTPDAVRDHWANLNGAWQFRFDPDDKGRAAGWEKPGADGFDRSILVPFGWESELSGIHKPDAKGVAWYRRTFRTPDDFPKGDRVWLHFGAVDWRADVWVNGKHVAEHEGGYTPFSADVTDAIGLKPGEPATVVVRVFDPTDPELPVGKQVGWYTHTSGIWQTVWLESRPDAFLDQFQIRTTLDPAEATIDVEMGGVLRKEGTYRITVKSDDPTIGTIAGEGHNLGPASNHPITFRRIKVPVKDAKPWSPESPHLYDITLELSGPDGVIDSVKTYFGLRTIARGKYGDAPFERILLNGKPVYLRTALDQSFNPKGVYTAPTDKFLENDIALAKSMGLNGLRIHIKPDEPRRLYWADRLGLLILEDMPNTWVQSPRARSAWETTMREAVVRDRNHPSIIAWIDFNETWGLGDPARYKQDKDTQKWVQSMVALTRKLDPTRLVEDNSPCNFDHVEGSDLNSWHFYIDDHRSARDHIAEVVGNTKPGSGFNFCPDQAQSTAPLINSEYGSVSAGGGDRDVSWGFRDLTTQLRRHPKIQGYVYTELSDIEWEHNGFVDYDRGAKDFGYEAFVPGMTPADLQGADFIGYDAPPAIVASPGETIKVPVFVSHYSERKGKPTLRWRLAGDDDQGKPVTVLPKKDRGGRPVDWVDYGVKELEPIEVEVPKSPFVGALSLVLNDEDGRRIAANFVNVVVQPRSPRPRVERLGDHEAALRFDPGDYARQKWSGGPTTLGKSKVYGRGKGSLEYRLKLPAAVAGAQPETVGIWLEVASKGGKEQVDFAEGHLNSLDYPQTDARRWPSTLEISINGQVVARRDLRDDPADARGVLSHLNNLEHGSYGYLIQIPISLPKSVRAELAEGKPLALRLAVPEDAEHAGGLCVFGAEAGRYPFDPTLIVQTKETLPADLGVKSDETAAIDSAASRQAVLLVAGDADRGRPATWAYSTSQPDESWMSPDFDDQAWTRGQAGFGGSNTPALKINTPWETRRIWLRNVVEVPKLGAGDALTLHLFHDEDVEVFVNGKRLYQARGYLTEYKDLPLDEAQKALFRPGSNVITATCRQTDGGQGIDLGLKVIRDE